MSYNSIVHSWLKYNVNAMPDNVPKDVKPICLVDEILNHPNLKQLAKSLFQDRTPVTVSSYVREYEILEVSQVKKVISQHEQGSSCLHYLHWDSLDSFIVMIGAD
ncbi:hypothetical protein OS493_039537 [Desmophyllum pertusum]|uniref:Uncharacterized protein n=1 Tax=Desmophyllum pertusum TaxID=174260 RepID=A0A9W9Z5M9_9CNID|nr:hypothetical protein OS493_039537 [Desmophyllum pertusum]